MHQMKLYTINSLAALIELEKKQVEGYVQLFRGQSQNWEPVPSIARKFLTRILSSSEFDEFSEEFSGINFKISHSHIARTYLDIFRILISGLCDTATEYRFTRYIPIISIGA